ncbi:inositol monophosphatase family protein [Sphaerochaeta halotolerans]|jgi:myo-inositol-1(or 4)-monophosphatase|uniref:Inositol-1-monophosphatase n=1 Tax=Sphaerochaeta halotolerans TaxID=2293840 RepID=A0A372MIY7_9SPIR|nr:inositol monophosphatase family protein [Sphaerochaeta halotolerans]MBG0767375.1 inositol monophosphatase [Spirochaetaceae bacterium]MDK2860633.1 monophosphatase [Sphaerochaeta sp.]MDN5333817.1 monophosphatase [Sphaerochaeta sp.]MXI87629.1 inositol monophosphatase [Sphaerochaeta halotolerans]RFU95276.1 inositol monophosphatase [Sphaerochaeta halotolerans]
MNQEKHIAHHLDIALQAAKSVGPLVLKAGVARHISVRSKHENDFVTETDQAAEQHIIGVLKTYFPDDAIFGEESGKTGNHEMGRWVIDPIDGTTNFFRSIPNYTISIAWELEPFKPLVGVVYNPRQQELFWASKSHGAFLNGQPIRVSDIDDVSKALMVCVPPHRHHELADEFFETSKRIFLATSDFRSLGSCALELSYIAAGRLDGYFERCLGYYDLAAGMLIVKEAGGKVESADPRQPFTDERCDLVASNGLIQDWILHMVHA